MIDGEMMCQMKNLGQLLHSYKLNENRNDDFCEGQISENENWELVYKY